MTAGSSDPLEDLAAIEQRIAELSRRIAAPPDSLVTFGRSEHSGRPHVEVSDAYYFVVCERGEELERRRTAELDELLYWTLAYTTFVMACDHEVRHRRRGEDFRRQLFAKQVELLRLLSPAWAERREAEHRSILARNPFRD